MQYSAEKSQHDLSISADRFRSDALDFAGSSPHWHVLSAAESAQYPYLSICRVEIWNALNQLVTIGTGWLAGAMTVVTAAHVVIFDATIGNYHVRVSFPSWGASVWTSDLRCPQNFSRIPGSPLDVAVLRLPSAAASPRLEIGQLAGQQVEVAGFPRWAGFPFTAHAAAGALVQGGYILHSADTYEGHSGAPILVGGGGNTRVVGVHVGGPSVNPFATIQNVGLAIAGEVAGFIATARQAWG